MEIAHRETSIVLGTKHHTDVLFAGTHLFGSTIFPWTSLAVAFAPCELPTKSRGVSVKFCRLKPEGSIAGVGYLGRQLAPSPSVRELGSAVSFPSGAEGCSLNDFSVL